MRGIGALRISIVFINTSIVTRLIATAVRKNARRMDVEKDKEKNSNRGKRGEEESEREL